MKYLPLLPLFLFAAPSYAATGTTFIGMIIVVVFVTIMLVLYFLVVTEAGSKNKDKNDGEQAAPAEERSKKEG
ncbi:hypothetical protein Q4520_13255 [Alteromonas sp. 1_MG-2023]|uniref:hypothetical protein n=1 Tax=Alteromonas sp. 1_MG-2023 TaxID=3062669 RepID=UPI0026E1A272|nr:hypothetical protein [Alteromonas sp. 1_MG-2023]MDO6476397.1 hypothetical protein [Alteromonas sp. 1_MG-2023]